jgi:hypothetical protein
MAPETVADLLWWVLSGAIFVCVAACAMLLSLLLKKLDTICDKMDSLQETTSAQDKAIVEIQTRCAFHHDTPLKNAIAIHQ